MNEKIVKIPNMESLGVPIHDFHCHLDQDFVKDRNLFGIQSVCIMPTWRNIEMFDFRAEMPNDFTHPNHYYEQLDHIDSFFRGWKGRVYTFLPVDFRLSLSNFHNFLDKYRAAGIKLDPLQNFPISHEVLDPFLIPAQERNLIVYIHTDWVPSTEWQQVKNLMSETFIKIVKMYPRLTFIMGHSGFNDSYVSVWKWVKKYPNVIAETSFAPTPSELEKIVLKADPTRLVFGSSFPLSPTASEIMKIVKMTRLTDKQRRAILYENALKILANQPYREVW